MNIQLIKTENGAFNVTGLNEKHLNALKQVLSTCTLGAEMLRAMTNEEAAQYFQSFNGGKVLNENEVQDLINAELEGTNCIVEILNGITTID